MKAGINCPNPDSEFYTSEKCHSVELSNTEDDPEVSVARARVEPGVTTQWHQLKKSSERCFILQGHGLVEIGDWQIK